jgi:hypothetical protein
MVKLTLNGDMMLRRRRVAGGIAICVLGVGMLIGVGAFLASRSVAVSVRNDTGRVVIVASCVDDGQQVPPGDEFKAEGHPEHGALACLVTYGSAPSQCLARPRVKSLKGTVALSQLVKVSDSECH